MIRVGNVYKNPGEDHYRIKVYTDEYNNKISVISEEELSKYTPLKPSGYLTFNIVSVLDSDGKPNKDVVVTASKILNLQTGDTVPYAVCRQSITDIFYTLISNKEDHGMVGLSINQDDCPSNFDFRMMLACNSIDYSFFFNIYRTDTVEHILSIIESKQLFELNKVLIELFTKHMKAKYKWASVVATKYSIDNGWCKGVKTLLKVNNFQSDVDTMLNILAVDFVIKDNLIKKKIPDSEVEYDSASSELTEWLSKIFNIDIQDTTFIEFDNDIDLATMKNTKYKLLRDNTDTVYLVVYTSTGEYLVSDLEAANQMTDFSTKFRLDFYKKYNNIESNN